MISSIQLLRGFSILLVVAYHLSAITEAVKEQYYFSLGKIGVDIFFIISGYIMALISERNERPQVFIKKRLIRIYPLYITVTLLVALIKYREDLLSGSSLVWGSLYQSLLMIPHYSVANEQKIFPLFIPGWTITYEMWFYISIALLSIFFTNKHKLRTLPFLFLFLYALSVYIPVSGIQSFMGNSVYFSFILGVVYRQYETNKENINHCTFLIVILILSGFLGESLDSRFIIYGLPAFLIFIFVSKVYSEGMGFMEFVGKISFSLYLTHVFTINFVEVLLRPFYLNVKYGTELMLLVAFVMSIVVATLSYVLFERKLDYILRKRLL